jgi:hypothetical protein
MSWRRADTLLIDSVTGEDKHTGHLLKPELVQSVADPARDIMRVNREPAQDIGRANISEFVLNLIQELRQIS